MKIIFCILFSITISLPLAYGRCEKEHFSFSVRSMEQCNEGAIGIILAEGKDIRKCFTQNRYRDVLSLGKDVPNHDEFFCTLIVDCSSPTKDGSIPTSRIGYNNICAGLFLGNTTKECQLPDKLRAKDSSGEIRNVCLAFKTGNGIRNDKKSCSEAPPYGHFPNVLCHAIEESKILSKAAQENSNGSKVPNQIIADKDNCPEEELPSTSIFVHINELNPFLRELHPSSFETEGIIPEKKEKKIIVNSDILPSNLQPIPLLKRINPHFNLNTEHFLGELPMQCEEDDVVRYCQ